MKKIIALALAAVMVLSFAACAKQSGEKRRCRIAYTYAESEQLFLWRIPC